MSKILTFVSLLAVLISFNALACDCQFQDTTASAVLKNNETVFLAIPSSTSRTVNTPDNDEYGRLMTTNFTILRGFKNMKGATVKIFSPSEQSSCGQEFKKNDGIYLVKAYTSNNKLMVVNCTVDMVHDQNKELNKIIRDLTVLTTK